MNDMLSSSSGPHAVLPASLGTRAAALARLEAFAPLAGGDYDRGRNTDPGPDQPGHVSRLSPALRHRLVREEEVLSAMLMRHRYEEGSAKFIDEVFWRGYFKGWLEQHPGVWQNWRRDTAAMLDDPAFARGFIGRRAQAVMQGDCDIDCMRVWAQELVQTGYLHNHARMWFASIWIFTLQLPWQLGARFFLQHLLDGDPASNTLSWRWVAGLHTRGKHYLARADNIARFSAGRFNPAGQLAVDAQPLQEHGEPVRVALPAASPLPADRSLLVITAEDCHPVALAQALRPAAVVVFAPGVDAPELQRSQLAERFSSQARADARERIGALTGVPMLPDCASVDAVIRRAQESGVRSVVSAAAPVGPVADGLDELTRQAARHGIAVAQVRSAYDECVWPHASGGFFRLRKCIPSLLSALGLR